MPNLVDANRRLFLWTAGATGLAAAGFGRRLFGGAGAEMPAVLAAGDSHSQPMLPDEGLMPGFGGATGWINSPPLSSKSLRGKVVLVNFWTYSCINSLRTLPYLKSWAAKYQHAGLVVIGVHTPEFPFEKEQANVEQSLRDYSIAYPVALDPNYAVWQAFNNNYWPAFYFVDGKGRIRHHQFGEGEYAQSERVIQQLLQENGAPAVDDGVVSVSGSGVEAAPSVGNAFSPETYIGYRQAERFASPGRLTHDKDNTYSPPAKPLLNQWGLGGSWNDDARSAVLQAAPGAIVFRFHSRDLHLVLGPAKDGKPVRFRVKLDGAAPGNDCGSDSASDGTGVVREYRLYQLIRQKRPVVDRTFEIEFLDPGVQAYSFTFG